MVEMEKLVSLCKRRGFIFQSSEIYGGTGSCWDYGPLGVELKNNIKRLWWRDNVHRRSDMVGLDASILMHPKVWEASGHVSGFNDPMVDCKDCKAHLRTDQLARVMACSNCPYQFVNGFNLSTGKLFLETYKIPISPDIPQQCPKCSSKGKWITIKEFCGKCVSTNITQPRQFNLMFKTFMGPAEDSASLTYLRPETAQGIFVNFENVLQTSRKKLPFGIAQIGKSFRNEITPGNFIFRSREFEQMEIEYFVKKGTDEEHHKKWIDERLNWYKKYGIHKANLHLREHSKDELAHYAKACTDIEYNFPMGFSELEGIANRQDFDLQQHAKFSGKELKYFDEETKEHITPFVIEPSAGVDRSVLAFLLDAYFEEEVRGEKRVVLKFHNEVAPIKIAVLPLLK
ncbi:MAG: glycine--tRNA ligase, partial [Planctomycetes bacterium RBG_16_43_13]